MKQVSNTVVALKSPLIVCIFIISFNIVGKTQIRLRVSDVGHKYSQGNLFHRQKAQNQRKGLFHLHNDPQNQIRLFC